MRRAGLLLALSFSFAATAQDFGTDVHTKPNPPSAARAQANAALEARDFPRALKLLAPLAAATPGDAALLYDLGSVQDALDQPGPAESSYRAAIATDSTMLEPRVALGLLLARAGKPAEARVELAAAVAVAGSDKLLRARAYRALARIDQIERPGIARDELLEALKLSPETAEDTLLTAELAASAGPGGAAAAETAYRRLLAERPSDAEATAGLAHLLLRARRTEEAEELLTRALAAHPGNPPLSAQLAAAYAAGGHPERAVPLLEALHAADARDRDVSRLLGELYLQMKNYALAEPLLGPRLQAAPGDGVLADEYADVLIHLKRFAEAQAVLTRAVAQPELFPTPDDLGEAAGHLAFAASENNDPAAALRALEVRATVFPPSAPTLFLAAISYDKLNQVKPAVEAYKQFLAASNGAHADEEFEAQHRLLALEHRR